jgi:pyruvate/2-oxoglutarate dehydrogenase complex dihydrolipoamide dehydrogenase (E3) component
MAYPDLGRAKSVIVLGGDHELVEPASRALSLGVSVTVVGLVGATSRQFERVGAQVLTIPSLAWGGF